MRLENEALTHTGLVREVNQDSILTLANHGTFLVADGMGGEAVGDEASARTVKSTEEVMQDFFKKQPEQPDEIEAILRETLLQANKDVLQIGVECQEKKGLGSTASLLCLHRGIYTAAQVGDSRIYLVRDGVARQITRDHTLVWALYEQGVITREQLETHPERHLLTQCIGNDNPLFVDTFEGSARRDDLFLVCSDGLTGYALEKDISEILYSDEFTLPRKAEMLIQLALDGGGGDNISVILVKVRDLDEGDDWEPRDSMSSTTMDQDDPSETLIDDTNPDGQFLLDTQEIQSSQSKQSRVIFGVTLLILLAISILPGLLQPEPVKVHLASPQYIQDGGVMPEQMLLVIRQDEKELKRIDWKPEPSDGPRSVPSFDLPGPGVYQIRVVAEGFLDEFEEIRIEKDNAAAHLDIEWTRQARLIIELPANIEIHELEVTADYSTGEQVVYRGDVEGLKRLRQVDIYIDGGILHVIRAEAGDGDLFNRKIRPEAGEQRRLKLFFGSKEPFAS